MVKSINRLCLIFLFSSNFLFASSQRINPLRSVVFCDECFPAGKQAVGELQAKIRQKEHKIQELKDGSTQKFMFGVMIGAALAFYFTGQAKHS